MPRRPSIDHAPINSPCHHRLTLAACALLATAPAAHAACANENVEPNAANLMQMRAATLCLLNAERTPRGLPPLRENAALTKASQYYSQLMVDLGFFAHVTPNGIDLVKRLTSRRLHRRPDAAWTVGENLAWGTGGLATPKSIMAAWMDSPGHRENVLTADFREVGLGYRPRRAARQDVARRRHLHHRLRPAQQRGRRGAGTGLGTDRDGRARQGARRPSAKTCRALKPRQGEPQADADERKRLAGAARRAAPRARARARSSQPRCGVCPGETFVGRDGVKGQ